MLKAMEGPLSFFVPGIPKTAGSKRAFIPKGWQRAIIVDDNPKSRDWKTDVSQAGQAAYKGPLLEGPLEVSLAFVCLRPKGHHGKNGVRPSAPVWPIGKPDVLKLARAVEDALTGIIWRDDAQVVSEHLCKLYGPKPGVYVMVSNASTVAKHGPAVDIFEMPEVASV
jgi:Holliday junction resolvase RusA-like endonuclease